MNLFRVAFRMLLGRRLPAIDGEVRTPGLQRPVTIRRDRWGVPYVNAETDADAWFGLGFCHAQDRSFQLETLLRLGRGALAEILGHLLFPVDRLMRRIGFHRAAALQMPVLDADIRQMLESYAAGVNSGNAVGLPRPAHEFAMLGVTPTSWTATDVLAVGKLQSFLLSANWDAELTRLKVIMEDGPEALAALDPVYAAWLPVTLPGVASAGHAADRLGEDVAALFRFWKPGGGSNNFAIASSRTATGRPLCACDPHLPPMLPAHWYLAHVRTPNWAAAGGTFVGGPGFPAGHNGFAAWGLTAGLLDNTDLFIEQVSPDKRSVRQGDGWVPCEVHREEIKVKGQKPRVEEVLITPRGPVVSPAWQGEWAALSMRAVWLDPLPLRGLLDVHRARSFDEFRQSLSQWPALSANMVYADTTDAIGWQLAGTAPRRKKGWGTVPMPGWDPDAGWYPDPVPFEQMPHAVNPAPEFIATANAKPLPDGREPYLGADFIDGYRHARLVEVLASRAGWDIAACQSLQMDQQSRPWGEMREAVLAAVGTGPDFTMAMDFLRNWDGKVSADSIPAAVYEMFVVEMVKRVARAKAPRSHPWVLGQGYLQLMPHGVFGVRRTAHLVRLLREQPPGWFARTWPEEVGSALAAAVQELRAKRGSDPAKWAWGHARTLTLKHPFGARKPLNRVFNLGPVPWGGDHTTPSQAAVLPLDALTNPAFIASLRMVVDVGNWEESRFILPGGQSGNPVSRHYGDMFPLWQRGEGIPIAWSEESVARATEHTLRLNPV